MTQAVGVSPVNEQLERLQDMTTAVQAIATNEFQHRLEKAQSLMRDANPGLALVGAKSIKAGCHMCKSSAELALLQTAKNITLTVHSAAASILQPGMTTTEVEAFIHRSPRQVGASGSALPHSRRRNSAAGRHVF